MMLQLITIIILIVGQQLNSVDQKVVDKNFALIEDFEENQKTFRADTFELVDQSTDGGQLIAYHKKNMDYLVFDIWLFGETGNIHATYWTDEQTNFRIVRRTDFKYDRPYYEKGYKVTETTEYLSYTDNSVRRYDAAKKEVRDSMTQASKAQSEDLFKAATKDLKIVK